MKNNVRRSLSGLLIGMVFAACGKAPAATPTAASTAPVTPTAAKLVKIRISMNPYTSFSPIYIAQEEGYFTEQGLEPEFVTFTSGSDITSVAMLQQRQLDVAGTGPASGVFNAVASSSELKIVADKGYLAEDGCTYLAVLAKPEWIAQNPTLTLAGLKGKRISLDPKNFSAYMFEKVLQPAGVGLTDMVTGDIKTTDLMAAVENGAVDFVSTAEPWLTRLTDTGKLVLWQDYKKIVPNMPFGFMMFGPSILVDNPELGKKFMTAYLKGIRQYNQGKTDRNVELIAKFTKLDPALIKRVCWPSIRSTGEVDLNSLVTFEAWTVQKGIVDKPVTAEQLWDPEFVAYANQLLGPAGN
jgi:NitT/TauT family transport system substrate-binding protein